VTVAASVVVVKLLPGRVVRISAVTNLGSAMKQWRRRLGAFLPVAVFECDPAAFCEAAGLAKLPATVSVDWAAERLRRAPVSQEAQPIVFRHIRRLGDDSGPLMLEWAGAVLKAAGREMDAG
jgi:hypothetical protein